MFFGGRTVDYCRVADFGIGIGIGSSGGGGGGSSNRGVSWNLKRVVLSLNNTAISTRYRVAYIYILFYPLRGTLGCNLVASTDGFRFSVRWIWRCGSMILPSFTHEEAAKAFGCRTCLPVERRSSIVGTAGRELDYFPRRGLGHSRAAKGGRYCLFLCFSCCIVLEYYLKARQT